MTGYLIREESCTILFFLPIKLPWVWPVENSSFPVHTKDEDFTVVTKTMGTKIKAVILRRTQQNGKPVSIPSNLDVMDCSLHQFKSEKERKAKPVSRIVWKKKNKRSYYWTKLTKVQLSFVKKSANSFELAEFNIAKSQFINYIIIAHSWI